jgi:hypothetical protein
VPFTDRFQLLDLKRDEGARTYEAREIATGRPVFVHLFPNPRSPFNRALLAKFETLPEEEGSRVIERGEHEGGIYIVTDRLAEYPGLREWLKAKNENRPRPLNAGGAWQFNQPQPSAPVKPPVDEQLANLFDTAPRLDTAPRPVLDPSPAAPPALKLTNSGEQTIEMRVPVEPPAPPPAPIEAAPPPPAPAPAGEFTRQFTPPVSRPSAPPKDTPPPVAPASASSDPGEFTRQFAPAVLRPSAPAATPAAQEPGEFTRQFAATPQKPAPPPGEFTRQFQAPQRPVPPRAPANPPSQDAPSPGEFTQMLQAQRPAAPAQPSKPSSQSGEFNRYFQSPMTPSPQGAPHIAPLTPPQRPSQPKDAGEFTQIFGRGDIPLPPPPAAPAAPPAPASNNATQVFATPRPATPGPMAVPNMAPNMAAPNTPAPNLGAPNAAPHVPGEYTQMFAKPANLTFGQAPAGPQAPRMHESVPPKRNNSRLPLLLVIGAAVLLICAGIVYLIMRQHST